MVQRRLFTKAAITLKLEALFVQNLTLRISTVGFVFVQFIELIRLTLINRDAKQYGALIVGVASRGTQTSEDPAVETRAKLSGPQDCGAGLARVLGAPHSHKLRLLIKSK